VSELEQRVGEAPPLAGKPLRRPRGAMVTGSLPFLLVAVFVIGVYGFGTNQTLALGATVFTYAVVAYGMELIYDRTGLLFMAQPALWAVGAYGAAIAAQRLHTSFELSALIGIGAGGLAGLAIAPLSLRPKGHYFLIVTFTLTIVMTMVITNLPGLTGGAAGLTVEGEPSIGAWHAGEPGAMFLLYGALALIAVIAYLLLTRTKTLRVMRSVRENEQLAQSVGINTFMLKCVAFTLSGFFAGLSGAMYAYYLRYLTPDIFGFEAAILLPVIVLVGGSGMQLGPVIGAIIVVYLPNVLGASPNVSEGLDGLILMIVILALPRAGVVGPLRPAMERVLGLLPTRTARAREGSG
jgi:branched-chain amino acid transport system permease protein